VDSGIVRGAAAVAAFAAALSLLEGAAAQVAQPSPAESVSPEQAPSAEPAPSPVPTVETPAPEAAGNVAAQNAVAAPPPKPEAPVVPPGPVRAPAAVLRVLDKVTAETMAFEAPVGRRVRFKSLVFEVKACETRGVGEAQPQPSAYVVITSDAGADAVIGARQLFKGWMFANAPSVHALTHPVYDAWLVSCSAATPAT
jgi:hypothetical protein